MKFTSKSYCTVYVTGFIILSNIHIIMLVKAKRISLETFAEAGLAVIIILGY